MATFSMRNKTRRTAPRLAFSKIAGAAIPNWDISLAFIGASEATQLNTTLRKKSYVPNVLSYEVGTRSGEILICLSQAQKEAPEYGMDFTTFVAYLFIHGCLHLKGYPHGGTMEKRENILLARFIPASKLLKRSTAKKVQSAPYTHGTTHRNRHRHRHLPGKTGGR